MDLRAKNNQLKEKIGGIALDIIPVSETQFIVSHWMDKIRLTKIIKPPIEFDKIKIRFFGSDSPDSCYMIIDLAEISYEICPKYPDKIDIPDKWNSLFGEYRMAERMPGSVAGKFTNGHYKIFREDNVIVMSGVFGPIVPLNENCLIIISGPFAGETIEFYPETGNLIHQNAVFVPVNKE